MVKKQLKVYMEVDEDQKFILVLFVLSLVVRFLITPIYVDAPNLPHDFQHYIDSARTGASVYGPLYGPLFDVGMFGWIVIFGDDYTLLKFPSILLDGLSIVLIFYIVKSIANLEVARYASVLYAFSYVALASSAVEGNDDHWYVFFSLVAIWYLVKSLPNLRLSAIFMGVAISFKILPLILFFLPIMFYVYQKNGIKDVFRYSLLSISTLIAIYMPFYLKTGLNVLNPYTLGLKWGPFGQSILVGLNMLLNYFTLPDWTKTLEVQNPLVEKIAMPFMLFGLFFASLYLLKFRISHKETELFRNFFLFTFVVFVFSKFMYESIFIGIVPTVVILFALKCRGNFDVYKTEIAGIAIILISILIYSYIYRWRVEYSMLQRLLLAASLFMSFSGTYLTLVRSELKLSWSFAVFSYAAYRTIHADLLMLLGPVIPVFSDYRIAWGVYAFGVAVLFVLSMLFLFYEIHYSISKDRA